MQEQTKEWLMGEEQPEWIVRTRGLPWSCTEEQLRQFFEPASSGIVSVTFTMNREGRPSGESYVKFRDAASYKLALAKDRDNMGHRYIEVFAARRSEMDTALKAQGSGDVGNSDGVVRLRGLPFGCTKDDIELFFSGIPIAADGVVMPLDRNGKPNGEAFVLLTDPSNVPRALEKHMKNIHHRYIEVFRSTRSDFERIANQIDADNGDMGGYGGGGGGGGMGGMGGGRYGGRMMGGGMRGGGDVDPWGPPERRMPAVRPSPYDRPDPWGDQRWGGGGMRARPSPFGGPDHGPGEYYWRMGGGYGGGGGGGYWGPEDDDGYGSTAMPMRSYGAEGGRGRGWGRPNGGGFPSRMMGGSAAPGPRGAAMAPTKAIDPSRHIVKMRGLPFDAAKSDIELFFKPLHPMDVHIRIGPDGRPSGEAIVDFATHSEAVDAMKKDREHMGHRYVELFLESKGGGGMPGGAGVIGSKPGGGHGGYRDFSSDAF